MRRLAVLLLFLGAACVPSAAPPVEYTDFPAPWTPMPLIVTTTPTPPDYAAQAALAQQTVQQAAAWNRGTVEAGQVTQRAATDAAIRLTTVAQETFTQMTVEAGQATIYAGQTASAATLANDQGNSTATAQAGQNNATATTTAQIGLALQTQAQGTRSAELTAIANQLKIESAQNWADLNRQITVLLPWFVGGIILALLVTGLGIVIWSIKQNHEDTHLYTELDARTRITPDGVAFWVVDEHGFYHPQWNPTNPPALPAGRQALLPARTRPAAPPLQEVAHGLYEYPVTHTPTAASHNAAVLALVEAAIRVAGTRSVRIPRWDALQITSEAWQDAVKVLKFNNLVKTSPAGTMLTSYADLFSLRNALQAMPPLPCPPDGWKADTGTPPHAHAQHSTPAQ